MSTDSRLLDVQGLSIAFPGHEAVRDLSFHIDAGETLALVGESGCGKSTTALSLLRLLPRSARVQGRALFDGQDLLSLPEPALRQLRGAAVSMVFQEPMTSLNPVLSVGEQVVEALRLHQPLSAAAAAKRAVELLDLVQLPEPHRRYASFPHQLSGGQRQRVMIAMAVASRPRLLVADEPTTALDVTIQAQILELLGRLRREFGMAMLLITHDLGLVGQWADRVIVMHDGRALEEAPVRRIFETPAHPYTRGLLGASLHLDRALHYREQRLPEIVHGREADGSPTYTLRRPPAVQPTAVPASERPILSVRDLVVRHPGSEAAAVDGVSFDIAAGQTVGLVGESGCGKSTLSKAIIGLLPSAAGSVALDGTELTGLGRAALRPHRQRVQMVFQDPYASLNPRRTVSEILEAALVIHGERDRSRRRARVATVLDRVGLPRSALDRYPHEFSGGQRQRIGIARALVLQPSLVICDEPVSALDVSVQAQILNLLVELKAEFGLSYLFISHDLAVVRYLADRVLVMQRGRIVEQGDQQHLWATPQHDYTRSLIAAVPSAARARPRLEPALA